MKFCDEYRRSQLDLGQGMQFHPVDGCALHLLHYDAVKNLFFIGIPDGGWSWDDNETNFEYPKISDERTAVQKGDEYPEHWKFDPWTGMELFVLWKARAW